MAGPITFTVPGGLHRTEKIIQLSQRIKATGKDVRIDAYDTVQGLQWNGGRLLFNSEFITDKKRFWNSLLTLDQLDTAVARAKELNLAGIPFHFVFNSTLDSVDLDDESGNYLLQKLHDEMNGVTIASRALRHHVSTNFPKYSLTASICFAFNDPERYRKACEDYDKVVVMPKFAYAMELLEGLPIDKLVFIVNDGCHLLCPRKDHYDAISRCNLAGNNTRDEQRRNYDQCDCFLKRPDYRKRVLGGNKNAFNTRIEKIQTKQRQEDGLREGDKDLYFNITPATRRELIRLGVRNFKLQGREYVESYYEEQVVEFVEKMVRDEL